MQRYTQRYVYDVVGNILRMQHAADGGDWTRRYVYAENGNRLLANSGPEDAADQHRHTYGYDVHGCARRGKWCRASVKAPRGVSSTRMLLGVC